MEKNNILHWLERRSMSPSELARKLATGPSNISRLMVGDMPLTQEWMERIATGLRCKPSQLLPDTIEPAPKMSIIGEIGEGSKINFFQQKDCEEMPSVETAATPVALRVSGNALYPSFKKGDVLIYDMDAKFKNKACIGRLCVVEISPRKVVIGELSEGGAPNTYNVKPFNSPLINATKILTAYKVICVKYH